MAGANADQAGRLFVDVAVSRCKLVSIAEEQQEIDLIRAVGIGGMPLRLDFGSIVVQDVENEVRLMLMGADDAGVAWNIVNDHGVCADALLQTEVFAAVPCVDGGDLRLDALAVAAGVLHPADVVLVEHRQSGGGIRDRIVGGVQGLGPQEVACRRHQCRVSETRHLRHLPKPHVGSHGDDTG